MRGPGRPILSWLAVLATLGLATASPAATRPSVYSQVLHTYETSGTVPPCSFTARELATALRGVDLYGQQYFADFTSAIQNALAQRDAGACRIGTVSPTGGSGGSSGGASGPPGDPGARRPLRLGSVTAATGAELPPVLLALALLAAGGLALLMLSKLARALAWTVAPIGPWRHLWRETGWRLGGLAAELGDWRRSAHRDLDRPAPQSPQPGSPPHEPHGS